MQVARHCHYYQIHVRIFDEVLRIIIGPRTQLVRGPRQTLPALVAHRCHAIAGHPMQRLGV
jgi:hypothetical protein